MLNGIIFAIRKYNLFVVATINVYFVKHQICLVKCPNDVTLLARYLKTFSFIINGIFRTL